ncbi:MAG: YchJ family protein [Myxococcota bacterium]
MLRCRCHSRKSYKRCCGPAHSGRAAATPVELMRSRYAAYALGNITYLMQTTHEDSPHRGGSAWADELKAFCSGTRFEGLVILDAPEPVGNEGFVTFTAGLRQGERDVSFTERSRFERVDGRWLYVDGTPEPVRSR